MVNILLFLSCLFLNGALNTEKRETEKIEIKAPDTGPILSILFPKKDQKVRGDYKIYGKAKPGAAVRLTVTSTYFKTAHDTHENILKGEGPLKRMNRKFLLTADRSGNWIVKSIELRNAGWEENFIITAASEGKTVSVNVYDTTHPVRID